MFLCSIHTRRSFGPSSAPYYPHFPRSLKTPAPTRTLKPGNLHRLEYWGPRECTHAQTYLYTHTYTHTHTHMPNNLLHVTLCTPILAPHSLQIALYTSLFSSRPLHVTLCTSLPTRRSLIAAPSPSFSAHRSRHGTLHTSFSTRHSLHATPCMPLLTCQPPHGTLCTSSLARHSLCKRVFITNVKGTFFGMSESEEASKRR